ncbi:hypothetical protein BDD12DRAFT_841637, partial [Trichophaea hybrida]
MASTSWGPNRLDLLVFGNRTGSGLYHRWWDGARWGPSPNGYRSQDGPIYYDPECVPWGPNRLDVFVGGMDSAVYHKCWDRSTWSPSLGVQIGMFRILIIEPPRLVSLLIG